MILYNISYIDVIYTEKLNAFIKTTFTPLPLIYIK